MSQSVYWNVMHKGFERCLSINPYGTCIGCIVGLLILYRCKVSIGNILHMIYWVVVSNNFHPYLAK